RARLPQAPVRVDQVGDLDVREVEVLGDVGVPLAVDAADADADDIVGAEDAAGRLGPGEGDCGRGLQGAPQEAAAGEVGHHWTADEGWAATSLGLDPSSPVMILQVVRPQEFTTSRFRLPLHRQVEMLATHLSLPKLWARMRAAFSEFCRPTGLL